MPRRFAPVLAVLCLGLAACDRQSPAVRPVQAPAPAGPGFAAQPAPALSAMAQLGKAIFFDASLSASGRMSCASCHSPEHAYAPPNDLAVQLGGPDLKSQGARAVPTLTYHEHTPPFAIGPDNKPDEDDKAAPVAVSAVAPAAPRSAAKAASAAGAAAVGTLEMVPQGGMDWDGRAKTLPDQAGGPLLDPREMANRDAATLLAKLKHASYAPQMLKLFGPGVFASPAVALGEAYFALARYQIEDPSFHRYDSKYDAYLAGRVALSEQEARGLKLFDDPKKGNCAACHLDKPAKDTGFAPVFTDYQFEALAAPRNKAILANRKSGYYDLGLCGPMRQDAIAKQRQYCGYFKTPTLRNVATRGVYFHNGVFHSLEDVVRFYVERETRPEHWYPRSSDGKLLRYDDLPSAAHANVDVIDPPFDRKHGDAPALSEDEIRDVVAFLKTLTDGYKPQ